MVLVSAKNCPRGTSIAWAIFASVSNEGMVCPYSLAVPGGVQAHVLGLAQGLRDLGHQVQVLAPVGTANGSKPAPALPEFVTPAGRGVRVPYNGSVVPLAFGPVAANRARRWMPPVRWCCR